MKKAAVVLMALLMLCLAGCSGGADVTDVDIGKVADELKEQIVYQDELAPLTGEAFNDLYGIDPAAIKDAIAYIGSGATAEEIVAIEMNDKESVADAEKALEDHLQYQKDGYADYGPDEIPKLEKAVLKSGGCYIFLSVSDDDAKAAEIIGSYLK